METTKSRGGEWDTKTHTKVYENKKVNQIEKFTKAQKKDVKTGIMKDNPEKQVPLQYT